jgi:DNA-binding response OmpR family regulator
MEGAVQSSRRVRFEAFEVDLCAGEVRKAGLRLNLTGQLFQILAILLERPGEVSPGTNCRGPCGPTRCRCRPQPEHSY